MKIRVGVFFGGMSVEHEVSVISAIQAIYSIDTEKYDVIPVYITKKNHMYVGEKIGDIAQYRNIPELLKSSQRIILINGENKVDLLKYPVKKFGAPIYASIDIAFPIVHGTNVEDGTLQGMFKMLNIPYVGADVTSSAIGMDKYVMKTVLQENDIPVLKGYRFDNSSYENDPQNVIQKIEAEVEYPVIVKPINLGSSVGIKIARDREGLETALEYAFGFSTKVLIEKAITSLREINCSVLGDCEEAEASECEEPLNAEEILTYEDKYMSGGAGKKGGSKVDANGTKGGMSSLSRKLPAELSTEMRAEIRELAVKTFKVLDCSGVSRIDFMIDKETNKIWVNEINTIPGSLAFYLWEPIGIPYKELLDRMIQLAFKRERELKDINFSFDTNLLNSAQLTGMKGSKC